MLHGIMNELGNFLGIKRWYFKKKYGFHMFSYYSLASGALVLVITVIADNKPLELCYLRYI